MDNIIAPLRTDLRLNLAEIDGQNMVIITDPYGFCPEPVAIGYYFYLLLNTLSSGTTIDDLKQQIFKETGEFPDLTPIIENINKLDEYLILDSEKFRKRKDEFTKEYLDNPVRQAVCVGNSYPSDLPELKNFLDDLLNYSTKQHAINKANTIFVPHIDLSLKKEAWSVYSSAYETIKESDADLFVIFGTAHYGISDYFMLTEKSFATPLGIIETDKEVVDKMKLLARESFTIDEFAHKPEHSIEFQVLLLQHLFKNKNFKILPILVGSFFEFINNGVKPYENPKIVTFLNTLQKVLKELNKKTVFIASVDFSHIGRKFGDEFDAVDKFDELKIADNNLIEAIKNADADTFFEHIKTEKDKWKVCGTAPIYSLLKMNNFKKGHFLDYNIWNEEYTKSAVSFASFAFYE